MNVIAWLLVGAVAGWIAGMLVPGDEGYGWIGAVVAGILGALVGGFLLGAITGDDWTTGFNLSTIFAAVVGAVIVVLAWRAIARRGVTT